MAVPPATVIDSVVVPEPFTGLTEKVPPLAGGSPVTANDTAPVNPLAGSTPNVKVAVCPAAANRCTGVPVMAKSAPDPTVSETPALCVNWLAPLPLVPVTVTLDVPATTPLVVIVRVDWPDPVASDD